MTEPTPFSIRIFLPDGTPDGLRIIEKSNWTGQGLYVPRSHFPEVKGREEFSRTGVYVLVGPTEEGDLPIIYVPIIYVGQGDSVKDRLEQHHRNKDFWTWAVFFVSKDDSLNRAHVQHLEASLVDLAKKAKRAKLDNQNAPQRPKLTEADEADVESFKTDMLSIFPLVGISAFEEPKPVRSKRGVLHLAARGVKARGYESSEGFVVMKGSRSAEDEVPSCHDFLRVMRKELREQGVLVREGDHLVFDQDYAFNSPSTAASVVSGRNMNGRVSWKDKAGKTLKEMQEASGAEEQSTPG